MDTTREDIQRQEFRNILLNYEKTKERRKQKC